MDITHYFALFVGFCLLYFTWRKSSHTYYETKFRLRLYKLRDDLRMSVIKGNIDSDSWTFKFLDYSLSKISCDSYFISVPYIVFMEKKYKKYQSQIDSSHNLVNTECKQNKHLHSIRDEMSEAIWVYIQDQHKYSVLHLFIVVFDLVEKMRIGINKIRQNYYSQKVVENVFYYPNGFKYETNAQIIRSGGSLVMI